MAICGISKRVLLSYLVPMISQVVPSSALCCRSLNSKCDLLMPFKSGWFQRSRYVHSSRMLFCVVSQPIATVRPVGNKISRAAMAEARAVLFDYLQNTRSFQFSDADHMSRNSDRFLLDLLSKVDIKENVTKSLWRYLHFHPINEFEPFFESLGMTPDEYSAYLPRDLMFLSDNQVLLDNFHDLCNYGIPHGKMGKIYAEAESIFKYDYGVLASKFRAYEEFGLSKSSLIKFFIFDPSLLAGDANTEFIDFLQRLNKIGLENDWLAGYVSAESSYNWARMSQTVEILDRLGYGGDNVAKLFRNEPGLLLENSGKAIQILIIQLTKLGFKKDDVVTLFVQDPKLMSKKCLKNLFHSMSFLFEIGMRLEDIGYVVQTHKHILSSNTPKRPGTVFAYLKVGKSALREMIKKDPTILFVSSSTSCPEDYKAFSYSLQAPARYLEKATFLKWLGYIENSEEFVEAAKRFRGRGDQLQERFNCLVHAGLDSYLVADIIKRFPRILNQSKEVLEQKMHLLTNVIGYPLESLVSSPTILCHDVKRTSLRFSMYSWMRDRGVAKPSMSLNTILSCSEKVFVKYFVDIHDHGQAAWEKLKESSQAAQTKR